MQGWLEGMFTRHRGRYLIGVMVAGLVEVLLVGAPLIAFFPAHYEGLSVDQYLVFVAVADGIATSAWTIGVYLKRRRIGALLAWSNGSRDRFDEARAWAFDGPRELLLLIAAIVSPFAPVACLPLLLPRHHTQALDWLEIVFGALTAMVLIALCAWFTLDVFLRPVRAALGGPAPGARPTSMTSRLALVVPAATWVAGCAITYSTSTRAREGAGHLLGVYAISIGVTGVCLLVLAPLFAGGVLTPIRELTRVARAVAAGRLDARLPITATDELGELGVSFNTMLDELRDVRARTVQAGDAARRRVERDLHDGAQQQLVLVALKLEHARRRLAEIDSEAAAMLADLHVDVERALSGLRELAHGLYPAVLETNGLRGALAEAAGRASIPVVLQCDEAVGRYPREVEAAIYFCCLEALQNAAKHGGDGPGATIRLAGDRDSVTFEVRDDGNGFERSASQPGVGIQNMVDRIGALGGKLVVDSAPGKGTTVAGTVPARVPPASAQVGTGERSGSAGLPAATTS
jgi:signal transduction histidine kinase